ncbi:flagellar hook assembly protein FlgD [Sphingomonas sp. H160509]|uniref:flagellar hook assembly protein FlgD n=1 Tax=Sphingomonas sp. H160509 TaxID=2955313 RepID=UPI00406C74F7
MATSFDSTLSSIGITRSSAATATKTTTAAAAGSLNQNDFLKLMTAQMQNQDPFNPVDNTQMVAQMAQFSSLAGISEMNTTMKAISDKLGATSASDAMGYVGKTVLTEGQHRLRSYRRRDRGLGRAGGRGERRQRHDQRRERRRAPDAGARAAGQGHRRLRLGRQGRGRRGCRQRPVHRQHQRAEQRHHGRCDRAGLGTRPVGLDHHGFHHPHPSRDRRSAGQRSPPDRLIAPSISRS